ncbi:MAG: hypothetical protein AB7P20_16440 [Rhizobiaceae bacterium]
MTTTSERERRWIVLSEDGRHVSVGRHTDPTEDEIARAGDGLRAANLGGWLAVMEGVYYRARARVSLIMVRELNPGRATWEEAVQAFTALRRAAVKPSPASTPPVSDKLPPK